MNFLEAFEELSKLYETPTAAQVQSCAKTNFDKAKAFIEDYLDNRRGSCRWINTEGGIKTPQDLHNYAFPVHHLARYYSQNSGNPEKIDGLMALLNILGYKVKDDYKSLQYLYHAVVQEEHLLRNLQSVGLTRNPEATKIHGDEASAYWYLFSDYSDIGTKTAAPDFKFKDDYTISVPKKKTTQELSAREKLMKLVR